MATRTSSESSPVGRGYVAPVASVPLAVLWVSAWSTQGLGAATIPGGIVLTRASTEYRRTDSGGSIAYSGTTSSNDVGSIVQVGTVKGLLIEGVHANLFTPVARGSNVTTSPWNVGATPATLSAGAGVDSTASAAASFSAASSGYGNFYQGGNYFGQQIAVSAHYKPVGSSIPFQLRWSDGSAFFATAGTLVNGVWQLKWRTGTSTSSTFQVQVCDGFDQIAAGGGAAGARGPHLLDMAQAIVGPRPSISWHPGTHAGTALRQSDPTLSVLGGRLQIEMTLSLPYSASLLRFDGRLWTLAGTTDTWVELSATKRRIRVSIHGVEATFPVDVFTLSANATDVQQLTVAAGNGVPTATLAVSTDGGATFGTPASLGVVTIVQPPIAHEGLPIDLGCDGTAKQLEAVHLSWRALGAGSTSSGYTTVYCSPSGVGNGLTIGAPASLSTALAQARAWLAVATSQVRILLRGGTYFLQTLLGGPLALTAADSGLTIQAYPGEVPELSGATQIAGGAWSVYSGSIYVASITAGVPARHITINGVRAKTASTALVTTGTPGWTKVDATHWTAPAATIAGYQSPTDVRLLGGNAWKAFSMPVASAIGTAITLESTAGDAANFQIGFTVPNIWGYENARELVASAGDFSCDTVTGKVYYWKRAGDTMATADSRLPVLEQLVTITGSAGAPATGIKLLGITFSDSNALDPLQHGWSPLQADVQGRGTQFVSETYTTLAAAVSLTYASGCTLGGCTLTRLGGSGLRLNDGAQDTVIAGCTLRDISGAPISVGWILQANQRPSDARAKVSRNTIQSCTIDAGGVHYWSSCAVIGFFVDSFKVLDCAVTNMPYSGVSVGWGWQYAENGGYSGHGWPTHLAPASGDTVCANNEVRRCSFYNIMNRLQDGASVYTVGKQPGTVVDANRTDTISQGGAEGIYLDNGSSGIFVTNNVSQGSVLRIQMFAPQATSNTVTGNWVAGPTPVSGVDYPASNTVDGTNTFYTVWPTVIPAGLQAVVDASGR